MTPSFWIFIALFSSWSFALGFMLWWLETERHRKTRLRLQGEIGVIKQENDETEARLKAQVEALQKISRLLFERLEDVKRDVVRWKQAHEDVEPRIMALYSSLQAIASQETEGANSTVRRMARIARQAMVEDDEGDFSEGGGDE